MNEIKRTVLTLQDGDAVRIGDTVVIVRWPKGRCRGRRVLFQIDQPQAAALEVHRVDGIDAEDARPA